MARPIEDIERAWAYLDQPPADGKGWRSIQISPSDGILVHAGRKFPERTEAMLIRFNQNPLKPNGQLPDGAGFTIEVVSQNDCCWLALSRREHAMPEFFLAMVEDIVQALSSCTVSEESQALTIFLRRVKAWQEFMRKGQSALSAEAEIGLFGELLVLRRILDEGKDTELTLESWIGPLRDGIQDFHLGTGAIEVKSTLALNGFPAKIGSLEQLDDAVRKPLFVGGVRLRNTTSGMSLPTLIETLRNRFRKELPGSQLFEEKLVSVGYLDMHAERYTRLFEAVETRFILVGADFPRFTSGASKVGIVNARYEIDLDKAVGEACDLAEVLKRLKVG
ncbi:PD-(D/E)XK motif protein [Diaphorobacter caeni]|uniref:PD-(D/E)XK motif protein n=1 Tax=Diaphorobacter caeni TaxID=2784387 RepID=UPI00188F829E|nr:PD-(D/E)XK motif protein [Diaphorobacter caeni]MBF5005687.1 PD-(D/E)XK motif protein [Diaphorobacter caeni]